MWPSVSSATPTCTFTRAAACVCTAERRRGGGDAAITPSRSLDHQDETDNQCDVVTDSPDHFVVDAALTGKSAFVPHCSYCHVRLVFLPHVDGQFELQQDVLHSGLNSHSVIEWLAGRVVAGKATSYRW